MNKSLNDFWNPSEPGDLERLIAGAKDYVVPSENLRPQIIEAAREYEIPKSELAKLRNFGICVGLTWLMAGVLYFFLSQQREHIKSPSSSEVQRMSFEYAESEGVSQEWALVEIFRRLRSGWTQPGAAQFVSSVEPESN